MRVGADKHSYFTPVPTVDFTCEGAMKLTSSKTVYKMTKGMEFGFNWVMICEILGGFRSLGNSNKRFGISFQKLLICIGIFI